MHPEMTLENNVTRQLQLGKDQCGSLVKAKKKKKVKINNLNVKPETINQTEICEKKNNPNFYFKTRSALLLFFILLVICWRLSLIFPLRLAFLLMVLLHSSAVLLVGSKHLPEQSVVEPLIQCPADTNLLPS